MGDFLCHWEIPSENPSELRKFYEQMFGWQFMSDPNAGDDYLMFNEGDKGVGGGITKVTPENRVMNYLWVEDIEAYEKKIVEHGGEIVKSKTAIPSYGFYCEFKDPHGNLLGLFEPLNKS